MSMPGNRRKKASPPSGLRRLWERARRTLAPHLRTGREGERLAARRLAREGYRILETNVRLRGGEIDLVAEEGGDLVFVEVKARRARGEYSPFLNVTPAKRRRIVRLAGAYCLARGLTDRPVRFDVVGIEGLGGGKPEVTIIRGAFVERR
jgi:putative endonuclease